MNWIKDTFGTQKPIVAMCHLQAMPGDPYFDEKGGMDYVVEMGNGYRLDLKYDTMNGASGLRVAYNFALVACCFQLKRDIV